MKNADCIWFLTRTVKLEDFRKIIKEALDCRVIFRAANNEATLQRT